MRRIDELAQALAEGTTTSRALIEESLARIADPDGEGARTFIKVHADQARAMADAADLLRKANRGARAVCRHSDRAEGSVRHRR